MSTPGLVTDRMQGAVGTPYGRMESYPVTTSDIRRWAVAVHHPAVPPARYTDPGATDRGALLASPDFNPFAWGPARRLPTGLEIEPSDDELRVGAVEHHFGFRAPPLRHALNGGLATTYGTAGVRPGDVVTAESVVEGYREREGRLGRMLLTTTATTWTNQDGEPVATHRFTLIRY